MVNPDMCVNQSKHTVSFSDFAWEEGKASFPKAWEVGEYLERYRERYGVSVRLGCRVMRTEVVGEVWSVMVREGEEDEKVCAAAYPVNSSLDLQILLTPISDLRF
jgi:cation diffusion facilitator CzcD-associated flavoprotein CzcO